MTKKHEDEKSKHGHPVRHEPQHAPKHEKARGPKYKLGDKVTLDGRKGEVVDVCPHDADWFAAGGEQLYGVKVPAAKGQDHTHDTLGGVKESELE